MRAIDLLQIGSTRIVRDTPWSAVRIAYRVYGAQERTRTFTSLLTLAPEASASTNFTTWADRSKDTRLEPPVQLQPGRIRNNLLRNPDLTNVVEVRTIAAISIRNPQSGRPWIDG